MIKFVPLFDHVLITAIEEAREIDGIEIPDISKEDMKAGLVVAIGPKVEEVRRGETVVFGPYAGVPIIIEGCPFLLMHEKEIKGRVVCVRVLSSIRLNFTGDNGMAQGPVTLNAGQSTIATVLYFDQSGNPMPSTFVPPAVTYTIDNAAIASSTPGSDGQSDAVAYVSAGVANLTASVAGPNGPLTDTETVTCNPVIAPPPVLSSVKISFTTPTP